MSSWHCEHAWLDGAAVPRVRVVADRGRISEVIAGADPEPGDRRLPGLVLPGLANAHSHAFHRALRGR
ncbi:MAG: formimidoylglutamate deiminase, partial [Pseudonocardia sp.]|nr:formimidoylglutamate deiminase [Pseudonocardia sp.]